MNPMTSPPKRAKNPSVAGPNASAAAPFKIAASDAITLVSTLD